MKLYYFGLNSLISDIGGFMGVVNTLIAVFFGNYLFREYLKSIAKKSFNK
jgi:hypothetical protein